VSDAGRYLVECYWPGVREQTVATATRRIQARVRQFERGGRKLSFFGSLLVPTEETVFCFFQGTEGDVRAVTKEAGFPVEQVIEWRWLGAGGEDSGWIEGPRSGLAGPLDRVTKQGSHMEGRGSR
jgi:hypothetical protein